MEWEGQTLSIVDYGRHRAGQNYWQGEVITGDGREFHLHYDPSGSWRVQLLSEGSTAEGELTLDSQYGSRPVPGEPVEASLFSTDFAVPGTYFCLDKGHYNGRLLGSVDAYGEVCNPSETQKLLVYERIHLRAEGKRANRARAVEEKRRRLLGRRPYDYLLALRTDGEEEAVFLNAGSDEAEAVRDAKSSPGDVMLARLVAEVEQGEPKKDGMTDFHLHAGHKKRG
jgi:hypothetical protein